MNNRLINTKVAGGGGGCTDIVDNYDPFGGNGVALYQLNGDATDVSGNYDGTATNVTYGTGVFGQAGVFNGSSSGIVVPHNSAFNTSSSFTISTWLNRTDNSERIVAYKGTGAGQAWFLAYQPSYGYYFYDYGTTSYLRTGTGVTSTGVWENVVLTWNSATKTPKIYINVTEQSNTQIIGGGSGTTTTADFNIGSFMSYTGYGAWNGSIDQVRIFNEALTPLEVEALYTEELCICDGTVDTLDILGDGSCIATYQLDGNANDLSGNYSGTPTNVSYGVGEFDLASLFNTSTSKILLPQTYGAEGETFSYSFWFNTTTNGSNVYDSQFIINKRNGANTFQINITDGGKLLVSDWRGTPLNAQSTITVTDGIWRHIVFTYDNSIGKIYINGVQETSMNFTNDLATQSITNGNCLGNFDQNSRVFSGSIDQVRIFNKALSAGEVTTLYNETACTKVTRTAGATQILGDSSCISYLKLDGDATDETGNYTTSVTEVDYGVGEFGQAGYFNQVYSSRIEYNAAILPANIFSVSMWMKVTNLSDNKWILTQYTGGVTGRFVFNYNADGTLQINTPGNSLTSITAKPIRNNVWQHIVLIKNGGSGWEIYVDNQSIGTWSDTTNITTNYNTVFGGNQNVTDRSIDGQLDNIRVFNKAVSASEVTTLYNEGI